MLSLIITAGLCLLPCVFAAYALRLFICLGAAAPAPTQKGAGAVSPHALPVQKCKGSAFGLHPCLLPAAREGDPSAPAALALPSEIGRTLRALPPPRAAAPALCLSSCSTGQRAEQVRTMRCAAPKDRRPATAPLRGGDPLPPPWRTKR